MADTSYQQLLAAAARTRGHDAAQALDAQLRTLPLVDTDALADEFLRTLDPAGQGGPLLESVAPLLCGIPWTSADAVLGLASLAHAEYRVEKPIAEAQRAAEQELRQGRALIETSAWRGFATKPSFETRQVIMRLCQGLDLNALLHLADDHSVDRRLRDFAIDSLARLIDDRTAAALSQADIAEAGGVMTRAFSGLNGDDINHRFTYSRGLAAWVRADREGALRVFEDEFHRTGKCSGFLRQELHRLSRPKAHKPAWLDSVRRIVQEQVTGRQDLESELGRVWLALAPDDCESWFCTLDLSVLPAGLRSQICHVFAQRTSTASQLVLQRVADVGGWDADVARAFLAKVDARDSLAAATAAGKVWRETQSAAALERIYFDHLQHLDVDAKFDQWMTLLGARGIREAFTFRATDQPNVTLHVELDRRGRLQGMRFDK